MPPADHQLKFQSPLGVFPDPGDGGVINPAFSANVELVTADAETRTLSDPQFLGQWLQLVFVTDGGDCVITADHGVTPGGATGITHDTAGEVVFLIAISTGGALRWRMICGFPESANPVPA